MGDDLIATVDLGKARTINKITAGFLQQQGSRIFLPSTVTFYVSDDSANWRLAGELKSPLQQSERVFARDFTCSTGKMKIRYVRVAAKSIGVCPSWHSGSGEKAWLFSDEITVE